VLRPIQGVEVPSESRDRPPICCSIGPGCSEMCTGVEYGSRRRPEEGLE
jgi:hypothetical protein